MKRLHTKQVQFPILVLCFLTLVIAGCGNDDDDDDSENAIIINDNNGADYNPIIDPANFVATIDNPYLTLTPGKVWVYEGTNEDGETERVEVEVTQDTKTVMGVATTVVRDRVWEDGELVEDTLDWYVQDREGNVWYFGEDSKDIEDGTVVSTAGSWEAGVDGAKPGIVMKANAQVGDAYRQEFLKGEAEDMGEILSITESVSIGLGNYDSCLKTKDWTPLEPDVVENKFYCKELGNVVLEKKVAGESGQIELIEVRN